MVRIYDRDGVEQSEKWLVAKYGEVSWDEVVVGWGLVEIREDADAGVKRSPEAAATLMVKVLNEAGEPVEGVEVARWWPDPGLPMLPVELQTYRQQGVHGPTNGNGDVGFGMGSGDAYWPPSGGASEIWLPGRSARMCGLGWLAGTNHSHLNLVFQWREKPPPGDCPVEEILAVVGKAEGRLKRVMGDLQAIKELLV